MYVFLLSSIQTQVTCGNSLPHVYIAMCFILLGLIHMAEPCAQNLYRAHRVLMLPYYRVIDTPCVSVWFLCMVLYTFRVCSHRADMLKIFCSRFACRKSAVYYNSSKVKEILTSCRPPTDYKHPGRWANNSARTLQNVFAEFAAARRSCSYRRG